MSRFRSDQPTTAEYLPVMFGFALFQIGGAVSRLGIPDALGDTAKSAAELTELTGADPDFLRRLLRAAVPAGLLRQDERGRFALTPLGGMYRGDSPLHGGPLDAMHGAPEVWQAWGALEQCVRTGRPAFDLVHGQGLFEHLSRTPEHAEVFHAAMAAGSAVQVPAIVERVDFTRFRHVTDVGGGNGTHLAGILSANPDLRGTVFDTSDGVLDAPRVLKEAALEDRCDVVSGSFFDSVPAGADAYLLKNILHDWDDDSCRRILGNCREALAPGGRIIVFSSVLAEGRHDEDPGDALGAALMDIEMMAVTTGRERTRAEFGELFADAGLKPAGLTPLKCPFLYYALEAVPA
ncbi:methyltransferase [Streptomyces sp. URMC 126]|uniref:methyltransferase n=1 Tax=Streptomyces sp. URMC 126 TaxID=3423401 RepID=UPI003F1C8E93